MIPAEILATTLYVLVSHTLVSPVSQNDDFVPVQAHLSSMEGYKVALEELRKKYDDNIFEKKEDVEILEKNVAELTEKLEVMWL